jgi:hypothetical protein
MHAAEDAVYIYGGYSKEKVTGSYKEGKVHEDVWVLMLKPALGSAGAAAGGGGGGGGKGSLDPSKATWQKVSRKGDFPSSRCGSAIAMYKSKALLFGGVHDEEGTVFFCYLLHRLNCCCMYGLSLLFITHSHIFIFACVNYTSIPIAHTTCSYAPNYAQFFTFMRIL